MTVYNPQLLWLALWIAIAVILTPLVVAAAVPRFRSDEGITHRPKPHCASRSVTPLRVHAKRVEQVEAA